MQMISIYVYILVGLNTLFGRLLLFYLIYDLLIFFLLFLINYAH